MLSDHTDWLDRLDPELHLFHLFNKVYSSYHLGQGKPAPSVFDDVFSDLDCPLSGVICG